MPELTEQEVMDILGAILAQISSLALHRHQQTELVTCCEDAIKAYPQLIAHHSDRITKCENKIVADTDKINRLFELRDKFKVLLNEGGI